MRAASWFDSAKRRRGGAERRALKSNPYNIQITKAEIAKYNKEKEKAKQFKLRSETENMPARPVLEPEPSIDRAAPDQNQTATERITETVIYVPHTP